MHWTKNPMIVRRKAYPPRLVNIHTPATHQSRGLFDCVSIECSAHERLRCDRNPRPGACGSGLDRATVVHRPRLLSDNGASYVAGDLAKWLEDKGMEHVRGAPYHPQTQGKIER